MVDFEKLRKEMGISKPTDPIELFRRLPRTSDINDLWNSQAEALKNWDEKRREQDIVIKLNTGGGKTLVGLIIAQSIANETNGSVLYLCPTIQLTEQTYALSKAYGFRTTMYEKGRDLDDNFLSGESILIATYPALFNAQSKFGTVESYQGHVPVEGIILDDAHTAFSNVRDYFTLSIERKDNLELYQELCTLFRNDFKQLKKVGTFDDIVEGREPGVLEIPYWSWKQRSNEIRERLAKNANSDYPFIWSLLRDEFDYCHALIDYRAFSITPLYPLVDKFPTFSECPRHVYMSATLSDDSSIIRTFNANLKSVLKPITPESLAGVGERMILAPALMNVKSSEVRNFVKDMTKEISRKAGVLILVPSDKDLDKWDDIAKIAKGSKKVSEFVTQLRNNHSKGPFVFSNRYDGLDLPNESCRFLIMDGLPKGANPYDRFRAKVLGGSKVTNTYLAQRIEQGIGRGTRGTGDYCVVILLGKKLISWISKSSNLKHLTPSTKAQLNMGNDISKDVSTFEEFQETINKCIERDRNWMEYHAEILADLTELSKIDENSLKIAEAERKYFKLTKDGYFEKAITILSNCIDENVIKDKKLRGWLLQLCARASYYWGHESRANEFQKSAFSLNTALLRPQLDPPHIPILQPGNQSKNIIEPILEYQQRKGYLSEFEQTVSLLTPSATSNQFEESLKKLGSILGFQAQRPDNDIGKGPDVLWLMDEKKALVIEAKSQKKADNLLTKDEHEQVLEAYEWFKTAYPEHHGYKIIVHPNKYVHKTVSPPDTYALTLDNLSTIVSLTKSLISEFCNSSAPPETLIGRCEKKVEELSLTPDHIIKEYLSHFEIKD